MKRATVLKVLGQQIPAAGANGCAEHGTIPPLERGLRGVTTRSGSIQGRRLLAIRRSSPRHAAASAVRQLSPERDVENSREAHGTPRSASTDSQRAAAACFEGSRSSRAYRKTFVSTKTDSVVIVHLIARRRLPVLVQDVQRRPGEEPLHRLALRHRRTPDTLLDRLGELGQARPLAAAASSCARWKTTSSRLTVMVCIGPAPSPRYRVPVFSCQFLLPSGFTSSQPRPAMARWTLFWKLASSPAASTAAWSATARHRSSTQGVSALPKSLRT